MTAKNTDKDVLLMRQKRVERIVEFIVKEYADDETGKAGEALWLAMLIVCGPDRAACIVRSSQVQ